MKAKILLAAVIVTSLFSSCASDCRNKKWRSQRFVEHKTTITNAAKLQANS